MNVLHWRALAVAVVLGVVLNVGHEWAPTLLAQGPTAGATPARRAGEGLGPFKTLVIRGALLIDGTGGPPRGPVDIVVEGNRIAAIQNAGTPGVPNPDRPDPGRPHSCGNVGHHPAPERHRDRHRPAPVPPSAR